LGTLDAFSSCPFIAGIGARVLETEAWALESF